MHYYIITRSIVIYLTEWPLKQAHDFMKILNIKNKKYKKILISITFHVQNVNILPLHTSQSHC